MNAKYIVTYELEVTAECPSAAVRVAQRRVAEVIDVQRTLEPIVWDGSWTPDEGTAHMTCSPRIGRAAGWRCLTKIALK